MKLENLIFTGEYNSVKNVNNIEIKNVSTSPKNINSGTLFVFIKSIKFDITKIIDYVLALKPAAILCEEDLPMDEDSIPVLRCENTRALLPYIYSRFYGIDFLKMHFVV